jgi:tripartite-type tricarboxylate transporter receptor subunit TctC
MEISILFRRNKGDLAMSVMSRRDFVASGLSLAAISVSPTSFASGFPDRPIRLVVPYSPGGGSDFVGRLLAQKLTGIAGWTIVVDNKAGASALIGTDAVAKSPADGYTLLLTDAAHTLNAAVQPRIPFDSIKDFAPLTMIGSSPQLLVAHPSFPADSLKELLALPRDQTRNYAVGTSGQGSGGNLLYEMLKLKTGMELVHVPYKGGGAALSDVIAGQIPLVINSIPACMPYIQAKKVKVLAIASSARDPKLPNVQTFTESVPGIVVSNWYGVMAPAKTPADVLQRLTGAISQVLDSPEFKTKMAEAYIDPTPRGPQMFSQYLNAEILQWRSVVSQTGFKLNN